MKKSSKITYDQNWSSNLWIERNLNRDLPGLNTQSIMRWTQILFSKSNYWDQKFKKDGSRYTIRKAKEYCFNAYAIEETAIRWVIHKIRYERSCEEALIFHKMNQWGFHSPERQALHTELHCTKNAHFRSALCHSFPLAFGSLSYAFISWGVYLRQKGTFLHAKLHFLHAILTFCSTGRVFINRWTCKQFADKYLHTFWD